MNRISHNDNKGYNLQYFKCATIPGFGKRTDDE